MENGVRKLDDKINRVIVNEILVQPNLSNCRSLLFSIRIFVSIQSVGMHYVQNEICRDS